MTESILLSVVRRLRRDEDGGAIVEFVVVLPVLLFLMFGIVDFSRAFAQRNNLVSAVREGGRFAATLEFPCAAETNIEDRVISYFTSVGDSVPSRSDIAVTFTGTCPDAVTNINVAITNYPFKPLLLPLPANAINLKARAVYRWERAP